MYVSPGMRQPDQLHGGVARFVLEVQTCKSHTLLIVCRITWCSASVLIRKKINRQLNTRKQVEIFLDRVKINRSKRNSQWHCHTSFQQQFPNFPHFSRRSYTHIRYFQALNTEFIHINMATNSSYSLQRNYRSQITTAQIQTQSTTTENYCLVPTTPSVS
jgi:hypothetical protein